MFEIVNAGKRTAVVLYKGKIVATLRVEREVEGNENYAPSTETVIQGLTVVKPGTHWDTTRYASTPTRGSVRYSGEPTVGQVCDELRAEEDYADGERAAYALQDGDEVPQDGSEAFQSGLQAAIKSRKKGDYYSTHTFKVINGVAKVKEIKK